MKLQKKLITLIIIGVQFMPSMLAKNDSLSLEEIGMRLSKMCENIEAGSSKTSHQHSVVKHVEPREEEQDITDTFSNLSRHINQLKNQIATLQKEKTVLQKKLNDKSYALLKNQGNLKTAIQCIKQQEEILRNSETESVGATENIQRLTSKLEEYKSITRKQAKANRKVPLKKRRG
jgi:hypothetical protein